jgi:hypothetical protein
VEREAVLGAWVRSHEEDGAADRVYRRPDYPFPPARGRESLELRTDGTLAEGLPGPTDVPEEAAGTWELAGDELRLRSGAGDRTLAIVAAEPDRLVVRGPS